MKFSILLFLQTQILHISMQAVTSDSPVRSRSSRFVMLITSMRHLSFSVLLHFILVVIFGTAAIYRVQDDAPEFVAETGSLLADPTQLPLPDITPPETPREYEPSTTTPDATSPSIAIDAVATTATSSFKTNTAPVVAKLGNLASLAGSGNGEAVGKAVAGVAMGRTGASTMRFMGTQAKGQSVVFVVDVSGSMIRGGGKSEKTYEVLEKEVASFIRNLDLKCTFGLVVFSADAKAYRPNLIQASSEEKQRAITWLKKLNPTNIDDKKLEEAERKFHMGTRADRGLAEAFVMGPDVIFFISDGEPTGAKPADILAQVELAQNERPAPASVNSIAYLADSGQRFMKALAEKNGGLFREVNPNEVK